MPIADNHEFILANSQCVSKGPHQMFAIVRDRSNAVEWPWFIITLTSVKNNQFHNNSSNNNNKLLLGRQISSESELSNATKPVDIVIVMQSTKVFVSWMSALGS